MGFRCEIPLGWYGSCICLIWMRHKDPEHTFTSCHVSVAPFHDVRENWLELCVLHSTNNNKALQNRLQIVLQTTCRYKDGQKDVVEGDLQFEEDDEVHVVVCPFPSNFKSRIFPVSNLPTQPGEQVQFPCSFSWRWVTDRTEFIHRWGGGRIIIQSLRRATWTLDNEVLTNAKYLHNLWYAITTMSQDDCPGIK